MFKAASILISKPGNNSNVSQIEMVKQTTHSHNKYVHIMKINHTSIQWTHPYNGILLNSKKEQTIDICNNVDESQMHFAM